MNIEEIMSSPVVVTKESTKLKYTRELISRKSINAVPVLKEDGEIAGILSSSDLAKAHDENMTVGDIMTEKVHLILKNNRVQDAAKTMIKHSVHHLVVMEDRDVIGMVSSLDIMKSLVLGDKD
ncbi:MAG: CBS domain-containing protein [Crocinitomix sp.]|nr:CBS domain-containing protein [Crocinitomix sp.]|tara:strand:+ start:1946 stop:2314 length:369 start_codon:yes stop_codon:yes gene_type:complete